MTIKKTHAPTLADVARETGVSLRAYPLFNGVTENGVPSGSSHYNSLNLRVERRLRSFVFNYIYSNWTDRDNYQNAGNFIDHSVPQLDPADRRNYLNANFVYPIPGFKTGGVLGYISNGWLFGLLRNGRPEHR